MTQCVVGIAKALGHLYVRLAINQHGLSGFIAPVERLVQFEEETAIKAILHREVSAV